MSGVCEEGRSEAEANAPEVAREYVGTVIPVTIVYVTNMDTSLAWYRRLLPAARLVSSSPYWSELALGSGASLALHLTDTITPGTQLGLALTTDRRLETVRDELAAWGVVIEGDLEDQPFGRSMLIRDPNGLGIQINEHDPVRYPRSED